MSIQPHFFPSRWFAAIVFSVALLNGAMAFAQTAPAVPAYKEDTPDPKFTSLPRAMGSEESKDAGHMLTGQSELDGAETLFTLLLEKGIYPYLTHKEFLSSWVKRKTEIKQKFFNPAKVQAALDLVNQITLRKMNEYATDNYHILARYQAMIFIGELNQSLPTEKKAVPLPAALPVMVKAAANPQLPTAVRIAALLGIKRHAEAGISDEVKKPVANAMLTLVKTKQPSAGESQEGQDWLRHNAAEIADLLGVNAPEVKEVLAMSAAAGPGMAAPVSVPVPEAKGTEEKKGGPAPAEDPFSK